jgi:hypothetical protein
MRDMNEVSQSLRRLFLMGKYHTVIGLERREVSQTSYVGRYGDRLSAVTFVGQANLLKQCGLTINLISRDPIQTSYRGDIK